MEPGAQWYSAKELIRLPGLPSTVQKINAKAKREGWVRRPRKRRGGGSEYLLSALPPKAQAAVVLKESLSANGNGLKAQNSPSICEKGSGHCPDNSLIVPPLDRREVEREALWQGYARATDKRKQKAAKKNAALMAVERLIDEGEKATRATEIVATQCKVDQGTLYRWMQRVKDIDHCDWTAALLDRHTGGGSSAEISLEASRQFRVDYLREEKPSASACYERTLRIYPEKASVGAFMAQLRKEVPAPVILLARGGPEALKRSFPAQKRDRSVFQAMQAVCADGHQFDVFVHWPDGEICRVVGVFWQDLFSGKILSYRIDRTENSDAVRLSFGDMVERYGIPDLAYLDNHRGFATKWLTGGAPNRYRFKIKPEDPIGILIALGTRICWCSPYWGQAKPIEVAFGDLGEYVSKHPAFSGAYTGNKPDAKPENYGSRAIPLQEFIKILDTEIIAHNARLGRRSTVCAGRSFDQVFNESYSQSIIRKATQEQKRLWLLAAEGVFSSRQDGSICLLNNRYWDECLSNYMGQRLVVRFDPQKLHSGVHVYALDGRFLCTAACIAAVGFNDSAVAREHARARGHFIKAQKEMLASERRMSALAAAKLLPQIEDAEPPESKLVRPIFAAQALTGTYGATKESDLLDPDYVPTEFDKALTVAFDQWREEHRNDI